MEMLKNAMRYRNKKNTYLNTIIKPLNIEFTTFNFAKQFNLKLFSGFSLTKECRLGLISSFQINLKTFNEYDAQGHIVTSKMYK